MRIVQLSDIHLSKANKDVLTKHYLQSLIKDLQSFHENISIDVILLTGDLVDQGGFTLGKDPYSVFRKSFIDPIVSHLNIKNDQVLFIPGNHDVDRSQIKEKDEFYLVNHLNKDNVNNKLLETRDKICSDNKRLKKFKEFEKKFHEEDKNYLFSYNESMTTVEESNMKVGFVLVNDSWRCSSSLQKENHYVGSNQLFNSRDFFAKNNTIVNIAVFHHPLDAINTSEKEDIENILQNLNFNIAFFGHSHKYSYASIEASNGGIILINGRSAFNKHNETQAKYQPGYNIVDLDLINREYTIHARKYVESRFSFDKDVDAFAEGIKSGTLVKSTHASLTNLPRLTNDLPSGYEADVNRVVKLLIGKSLYPNQYIFVRELIQNSVDACKRIQDKYTNLSPKITVRINSSENSFEIIDEGDGMSKKILRDHFSVIGKSISQEFSDSIDGVNLISQFGIGFMSTFIVAQKIYIRTKSEEDELINFEIQDVFKGFNYTINPTWGELKPNSTGTSVKVYLKSIYSAYEAFNQIKNFCRHVANVDYYYDESLYNYTESWNTEGGIFDYEIPNSKYVCKLTIGPSYRTIIASNSGFLINSNPLQIIPARFPNIIGGEVNFEPRNIDFDLSRTNIMDTKKAYDFKMSMSISLRYFLEKF